MPTNEVSAADISTGGVFIDADRPVRVGARFSVQIELPDGEAIYIPEAQVVYNRERRQGAGFGASFVSFEDEAQRPVDFVMGGSARQIGARGDQHAPMVCTVRAFSPARSAAARPLRA